MAAQFSGAQNLTGRVTVLIKDGVSVSVGDIKIRTGSSCVWSCESDNPLFHNHYH